MEISTIFAKDISRPIEGVVKADDVAHLRTEVDEYVITNEVASGLELFLEAYTGRGSSNGAWVSGFFGSGKSHLLKMLAHLLGDVEGQDLPRNEIVGSFLSKADGAILPGLLRRSASIEATSLLFNIDQKASLISKDQSDALLKVFVKVFNESRGYYGNQGHVARFEQDLDRRGQLAGFVSAYERIAGRPWTVGREEGVLEERNIARAYEEASGEIGVGQILTKYRNEYSVSIEDFANEVHDWLDAQPKGYRLNFFVDEVGQFIGTNTKLMLNLQTIAESLASKCQGRAWIIVTSQEDMDKVVGDRTKQQSYDFSKIQARFETRLKLTSADVEEVIRRRLLEKSDAGRNALEPLYAQHSGSFKMLFGFADGGKTYRTYGDDEHFVGTYPFVPYQFPVFQAALEGLSDHNLFEGRANSVGERSMLAVVQDVAQGLERHEVGALATFDRMYQAISTALKTASHSSIAVAERNLLNPLAVRVLKALFLVKYVEGFVASPRNVTVLVYERLGVELSGLTEQVTDALALLEAETYVHRTATGSYEFLTNDEQRIEQEIKNVDLDNGEVAQRLGQLISSDVLKSTKVRFAKTGPDFAFGIKLDDTTYGAQRDLTLRIISPASEYTPADVRMQTAGRDEVTFFLGRDERLIGDFLQFLKTEKYVRVKNAASQSAAEQRIVSSKLASNAALGKELGARLTRSVATGTAIVDTKDVPLVSGDAVARVIEAFQVLISRVYPQLSMLGGLQYAEAQITQYANPEEGALSDDGVSLAVAPSNEVKNYVARQDKLGASVSVQSIVQYFEAKPYGWPLPAVEVMIARLVGRGELTLSLDGGPLKRSEVPPALKNTAKHAHTAVRLVKSVDPARITALRELGADLFDDPQVPKAPDELAVYLRDGLKQLDDRISVAATGASYPFLGRLKEPLEALQDVIGKPLAWYLEGFPLDTNLTVLKQEVISPILNFLSGNQRLIYDDAVKLLQENGANLSYLPAGSDSAVRDLLEAAEPYRGGVIPRLKQATTQLRQDLEAQVTAAREQAEAGIRDRAHMLQDSDAYKTAVTEARTAADERVAASEAELVGQTQVAAILQLRARFDAEVYPKILDGLTQKDDIGHVDFNFTVSVKSVDMPKHPLLMQSQADVDEFLEGYRSQLMALIDDGKQIVL